MLLLESDDAAYDSFGCYAYANNDPANSDDPSGLAPEQPEKYALKPPANVPELFTYRYTEQEWAAKRIEIGSTQQFGKYSYIAVSKTDDPESVGSAALSNIGRGIHDIPFAPIVGLYSLFTWSNKFYGPRDRIDYVDVTYKLSYQYYMGSDKAGREAMDQAWLQDHKNESVQGLSGQLNKELKYFYIEQFGIPAIAETVGGVFQLRTAIAEANASVGGVGPGNVTVYRVEGTPNARIAIGENGSVVIAEDKRMLFLNFGNRERAEMYFADKVRKNLPGVKIKSFEVPKSFLDDLRLQAVPYSARKEFPPGRPYIVDEKFPDQYGLRPRQVNALRNAVIQGTGKVEP